MGNRDRKMGIEIAAEKQERPRMGYQQAHLLKEILIDKTMR